MLKTGHGTKIVEVKPYCEVDLWVPLYTHPFELTDEEIDNIENAIYCKTIQKGKTQHEYIMAFAKAILRKAQEQ